MADAGNLDVAPSQKPALDALIAAVKGPQPPYVLLVSGTPFTLSFLHPLSHLLSIHSINMLIRPLYLHFYTSTHWCAAP